MFWLFGNAAAYTPNLDALIAQDAVSFRYTFCQNPLALPSRCSFMTRVVSAHWGTSNHELYASPRTWGTQPFTNANEKRLLHWWSGKSILPGG